MSLPRFLDRVIDAAAPALGSIDREAVRQKLSGVSVTLAADEQSLDGPNRDGFLLAANLAARLYPRIRLQAPSELARRASSEIILINPVAEVSDGDEAPDSTATLGYNTIVEQESAVSVAASGWNVHIDPDALERSAPSAAAALAAAALGVGELFRIVFADELAGRGRRGSQPGAFNLVTLGEPTNELPARPTLQLGEFALVGAGAIGQAAAHTLAVAGAQGTMLAIDHEPVSVSNLQRYLLARDSDIGTIKVELLQQRLTSSGLEVVPVPSRWHAGLVEHQRDTLVALDTPEDRIAVQASLPGTIFNAWTQPADIGFSRHEHFGVEPCLACLYWPDHRRPSQHEQVAAAFHQHPLRVLSYLARRLPVGLPLPADGASEAPGLQAGADMERWTRIPLIEDIALAAGVDGTLLAGWRERTLAELYQDGICGGALMHLNVGAVPHEVLVPLAHQSALAGVMLATQLIIARTPLLAARRPVSVEGRYDVLAGMSQTLIRPRAVTPACFCNDPVYRAVYAEKSMSERSPDTGEPDGSETGG
jgi:ThiF family